MKLIVINILLLTFVCANAYANDKLNCLRDAYLDYTSQVSKYWDAKDAEFRKSYPKIYKDFMYLITEQKDHNRMQEITVEYLIKKHPDLLTGERSYHGARKHPDELNLDGSLYNMVPRYKHYEQKIYRELRAIPEFTQLYIDIESYKKENKMPVFEDLKAASNIIFENLDGIPSVIAQKNLALKKAEKMVSSLSCGS